MLWAVHPDPCGLLELTAPYSDLTEGRLTRFKAEQQDPIEGTSRALLRPHSLVLVLCVATRLRRDLASWTRRDFVRLQLESLHSHLQLYCHMLSTETRNRKLKTEANNLET